MPRDEEVTHRAGRVRAMTGFSPPACSAFLAPFAHACLASMADHPRDGQPRTSRRYRTEDTSPVPTMADKWLCLLTDVQPPPLHAGQGQLVGLSHAQANPWRPLLPTVRHQAFAPHELVPARPAGECATLLTSPQTQAGGTSPLGGRRVLSDPSSARGLSRSRRSMTMASSRATRAHTASSSMRPVRCASCVPPLQGRHTSKAWRIWRALAGPPAVRSITSWASRDSSWPASRWSNPRSTRVGRNVPRRSKRPRVDSPPCASAGNTPGVG
jgi:hypothetical protein